MAKFGLTYRIKLTGLDETLAAFKRLPKEANQRLRLESQQIARKLADAVQRAAAAEGGQWGILARTVKAKKDRVPVVQAGGTTRLGRNRKQAYKLLFGAEFGATFLHQFKPRTPGNVGYVFFPTARREQPEIDAAWNRVAEDIERAFGEG